MFQVLGAAPAEPAPFGPWVVVPAPAHEVASFGPPAAPVAAPIWRADLPADPAAAMAHLAAGEAALARSRAALDDAAGRLEAFVRAHAAGPSFSVGPLPEPEAELARLLADLQRGPGPTTYGLLDGVADRWDQAVQQLQASIDGVGRVLAHYAWVETVQDGRLVGCTAVGWTGHLATAWALTLAAGQGALHQRTLDLALASRAARVQAVTLAVQGAGLLAAALAWPLGPVLALPAVWRFIEQVLAALREREPA